MKNIFDLEGKVAVVTGGYGHLGGGMVEGLLSFGAKVIVAGRIQQKFEDKFKDNRLSELYFEQFDISKSSAYFHDKFKSIAEKYGAIDIVINNAHFARGSSQLEMSDDDWAYSMDGVLGSVHKSIKAVVPIMREQGGGKIINIASMYGHISPNFEKLYKGSSFEKYTNPPHYGAAKAGVIQLTKYYGVLLGPENIYVNAISPGPFSKVHIQQENPEFIERLKSSNPLRKLGAPEDLIGVVVLLSSNASNFITGQNFCVDGGWAIW